MTGARVVYTRLINSPNLFFACVAGMVSTIDIRAQSNYERIEPPLTDCKQFHNHRSSGNFLAIVVQQVGSPHYPDRQLPIGLLFKIKGKNYCSTYILVSNWTLLDLPYFTTGSPCHLLGLRRRCCLLLATARSERKDRNALPFQAWYATHHRLKKGRPALAQRRKCKSSCLNFQCL